MSEIRNFDRADAGAVAALFQRTFRDPRDPPGEPLAAYLAEVFLDHPWYDPDIAARVNVNADGRVTGFVGVFPGRLEFRGRTFRAAIAGTLMVENPEHEPLAGAKLLRSVIKGPQDLTVSESTNPIAQALWERTGGSVAALLSLDFVRVFRPARAAVSMLAERHPPASVLGPAAWIVDRIARPWIRRGLAPLKSTKPLAIDTSPSDADFASAVLKLSASDELHPAWTVDDIEWFLAHAKRKARYGELHRSVVRDQRGEVLGCYLYHGRRDGSGRVLHAMARKGAAADLVDCLFRDAEEAGLAALRGRTTPPLVGALLTRNCLFLHRSSTVTHTMNDELADAIARGDALITGLAGESWTRLIGDDFD